MNTTCLREARPARRLSGVGSRPEYLALFVLSLAFALVPASTAQAQLEARNWIFGRSAGLVFSPNPVAGLGTPTINTQEGSAVISDQNGNLLFYTDGRTVWNKNHQQMPNGTGLRGGSSATQSAIIVPWPGTECQKYFVITVTEQESTTATAPQELSYSVVDMSANSGLGDVDAATKNTQLRTSVSEKLTAVTDAAGTGYWFVAHGFNKTTSAANSEFYAYHVDASGIATPVVSVGNSHTAGTGTGAGVPSSGQMKISPDGTVISCAVNTRFVEILGFKRVPAL